MKPTICITKAIIFFVLIFGTISIAIAGDDNLISTAGAMDFMSGTHTGTDAPSSWRATE